MKNLWYKQAVVYSLDVETFMDSDGDGIGDFNGLTQRLDYLAGLGINCLWLLPFYPSPNRDNGYDVMDYYNVDPRLGTLGDFVEFLHQARDRGIHVIIDLVVNHTSNQHPWFEKAKSSKDSHYHQYYVWCQDPPEDHAKLATFPGTQTGIWEYEPQVESYYLHRFYKEQPDLNISNPAVQEEIQKIMGFWLEIGVSGFRVDAAPFLIEPLGLKETSGEQLDDFLSEMRAFITKRRGDAILLAEANVEPDKISIYFGQGNRMQILFNFIVNQHLFLALAQQKLAPLKTGFQRIPEIPSNCQWLNFLRHHDELTLDQLEKEQQQIIFQAFAPEETMQIYGRGVRRRLPPMLNGDRHYLELAYSLMFALPGTPLLRYGDEIGMGDDLCLEGRDSVRTVMQWSNRRNGGFSTASADQLPRPAIATGDYRYEQVNVADQQRDPNSFLTWIERLIRTRRQCSEFGLGDFHWIETDQESVMAHYCQYKQDYLIAFHNLSSDPLTVTLKTPELPPQPWLELWCDRHYESPSDHPLSLSLRPYGYRWFRADGALVQP